MHSISGSVRVFGWVCCCFIMRVFICVDLALIGLRSGTVELWLTANVCHVPTWSSDSVLRCVGCVRFVTGVTVWPSSRPHQDSLSSWDSPAQLWALDLWPLSSLIPLSTVQTVVFKTVTSKRIKQWLKEFWRGIKLFHLSLVVNY